MPKFDSPVYMDSEVVDEATGTEVHCQTELTVKDISNIQKELSSV